MTIFTTVLKLKLSINIHVLFIINILIIIALGLVVTLLRSFTDINLVRYILFLNLLNNAWYIILNLPKIKLKPWTALIFVLAIISFFKGIFINPISDRSFLDLYKPLSFIIVYQIFSSISIETRKLITAKLINDYARYLKIISIFFGVLVVILLIYFKGYPGLRLPLIIPISVYAVNISNLSIIALIIVGLFSGKRAILVATFPALFHAVKKQLTVKKIVFFSTIVLIILIFLYPRLDEITTSKAFNKYNYTFEKYELYKKTKDLEILNHASGQRLQEVTSGFYEFKKIDYLFGKGVGYTYDLYNVSRSRLFKQNYGNIHFTPASLVMSYGVLFMVLIYSSIISILYKSRKLFKKKREVTIKILYFIVLSYFVESFFAFTLFLVPFFPICLGLLSNYLKNNYNDN